MFTQEDYFTSSGKYPERAKSPEITDHVRDNALDYTTKLNAVRHELGLKESKFSSGFRPSVVNKKVPNAAKKSKHMSGDAGDEEDRDGSLAALYMANLPILEKHGLWMEDPRFTKGWVHTQRIPPRSGKRVFIP